ncbi:MAG: hypothetical protein HC834_07330 [Rhodospirillales bacterium]|nr:hypothetical protein [Rhodospirillales bacterium]
MLKRKVRLVLLVTLMLGAENALATPVPKALARSNNAAEIARRPSAAYIGCVHLAGYSSVGSDSDDLEFLPKDGRETNSTIGMLLIVAAVIVLGLIVGFVIRHHRQGRAG